MLGCARGREGSADAHSDLNRTGAACVVVVVLVLVVLVLVLVLVVVPVAVAVVVVVVVVIFHVAQHAIVVADVRGARPVARGARYEQSRLLPCTRSGTNYV